MNKLLFFTIFLMNLFSANLAVASDKKEMEWYNFVVSSSPQEFETKLNEKVTRIPVENYSELSELIEDTTRHLRNKIRHEKQHEEVFNGNSDMRVDFEKIKVLQTLVHSKMKPEAIKEYKVLEAEFPGYYRSVEYYFNPLRFWE